MSQTTSSFRNPGGNDRVKLARTYNDAILGLKILHEAVEAGSLAALEKLRRISNDLVEAGGRYGYEIDEGCGS